MIYSVAKETGWSEDYLLDMPLGRLWIYRHCIIDGLDLECRFVTNEQERQEVYELFEQLKERKL